MKCVYLAPSELQRYERNARAHGDEDIAAIKESIKSFGFNDPVGIWGENNIIVEGHGRVTAALQLGLEKIPCIRLDWMTDEQRRAYALAHNKTAELSGWDFETLDEELESINQYDMSLFGFGGRKLTDEELNSLLEDKPQREKEPKMIQCAVCGKWYEVK